MTSQNNLNNIINDLRANGVEPKVTVLKTKKPRKNSGWFKGNGPTPNCGLHGVNAEAGYNPHGNGAGKLA